MEVKSRVPGKVTEVKVKEGDEVKLKDILLIIDAMKMAQPVPCPQDGVVKEIRVKDGDRVNPGSVLVVLE